MFTTSATCSQQLTRMKKSFSQVQKHSHNHYNTFTTNLRLIDTRQKYYNAHNKARIPATISQQGHYHCITKSLQQVHNKMSLYGNQALNDIVTFSPLVYTETMKTIMKKNLYSSESQNLLFESTLKEEFVHVP